MGEDMSAEGIEAYLDTLDIEDITGRSTERLIRESLSGPVKPITEEEKRLVAVYCRRLGLKRRRVRRAGVAVSVWTSALSAE